MVDQLVKEIRKALENELYFVALNSALTLPDICGKVAYPNKSCGQRYILWYDEEIGKYEKKPCNKENMPYLSGKVIYSLRCSLLHEGNPNVDSKKASIDHFSLVVEKEKPFNAYVDASLVKQLGDTQVREYRMNVRRICMILCETAESYYKNNRGKFDFNYKIVDWDEIISHLPPIGREKVFVELDKSDNEFCQGRKMGENE